MGTPVLIRAREEQCIGDGPCSEPRPMTEEEMLKYYTKEEIEEMSKKISPPAKEKLIEVLAEVQGKTKSVYHAAKVLKVSHMPIVNWIKDYGIEFDAEGKVIVEEFKELDKQMQDLAKVAMEIPQIEATSNIITKQGEELLQEAAELLADLASKPDTITITGQETKEIRKKLGYAEHDIGNATIIYDFRADLVKIVTPNNNEMTPEVARAVAEDILDILGHE
jgi:DNA repair exonuclease SbcCD ATPase subunit